MKTKNLITAFFLGFYGLAFAERDAITISELYTNTTGNESITAYGNGLLGINYNYDYDYYDEYGEPGKQKPLEITLYDSTFKVCKKLKFVKIGRWFQRVEISKDGNNVFVFYQPTRWNRSVAGGTVKLFVLDKNLTCTRICKFIIPGSRPSIYEMEKISGSNMIVYGSFTNRGRYFMYNVNLATRKIVQFKLPKEEEYYLSKHFSQDNKTFLLTRGYNTSSDSLRLTIFTNTGTLLKRQWITISPDYPLFDVSINRIGKNKYLFYGTGNNNDLPVGHRAFLYTMLYDDGKISKTIVINESIMDMNARNDFSKIGLTASNENLRKNFIENRKKPAGNVDYFTFMQPELFVDGIFFIHAGIRVNEQEGGVLIELDENLKPLRTTVFPVVENYTVKPGSYKFASGKSFFNKSGFYYAYCILGNVTGIHIDRDGNVNNFAFDTAENDGTNIPSATKNGFLVLSTVPDADGPDEYLYKNYMRRVVVGK